MKLKSIQFSVAALAGASVLSVVVVLVLYALFAGARTQELVQKLVGKVRRIQISIDRLQ